MVKQLKRIIQCYDLVITTLDQKRDSVIEKMPTIKNHFLCLLMFQKSVFEQLLSV